MNRALPWRKSRNPFLLHILADGSWRPGLPKGSWEAFVWSESLLQGKTLSNLLSSCSESGQAEILAAERALAEVEGFPKGSAVILLTDYLRTAKQAARGFPVANQDSPEERALKKLQERIARAERSQIHISVHHIDKSDPEILAALRKAHNAAREELQKEEQRQTPPRRRCQLPRIPER